jgi:outer membrane receptor protein involved in Fe transport
MGTMDVHSADEPVKGASEGGEAAGGGVRGVVRNADQANAPVEGASIQVVGTRLRTTTRADGSFEIQGVPAGERQLQVLKEGLRPVREPVVIRPGETAGVDIGLVTDQGARTMTIKELVADAVVVLDRTEQTGLELILPRHQIAQKAGSDVAKVVEELPGVNTVDGKYVFVRGLGERYSQTLLNRSTIPSPEPDKRVVPLDLFPTSLVEEIRIVKTFSPDLPGEFAGGSVQVETIDVPEERFFTLGADIEYRHGTTFRDFNTYHGGNLDTFSFDDGTREIPDEIPRDSVSSPGLSDEDLQAIGRSFPNIWEADSSTAPLDHKLSLSFGERLGKEGSGVFGVVGALNWANKYQQIRDEEFRVLGITGDPETGEDVAFVFSDYRFDTSTFEAELSGALNLAYEINPGHTVGVRNLYTRSAEDEVRLQSGTDGQIDEGPIELTRLRWVERSLFTTQPFGEHVLFADTCLEWRFTYALSQRDEPDNRQVQYTLDPSIDDFRFDVVFGSGRRDFFILDENIYDAALDYSIPFNPFGVPDRRPDPDRKVPEQRIKLGPAFLLRDRDFEGRRFRFRPEGGGIPLDENGRPVDLTQSPEELFQPDNINPDGWVLIEETRRTDVYQATQYIVAGYALADFRLHPDWRIEGGARVEWSDQTISSFDLDTPAPVRSRSELETTDVLPSLTLIWEFLKGMQLRAAGSGTVSRPEFRELAPFDYTNVQGGITSVGNPDLERAKIWNADLGWEWFPGGGDIVTAGLFYKHFTDPIEVVNEPISSGLLTSWENADSAHLFGIELETRKNLAFLNGDLKDLSLLFNYTWMWSEVRIPEDPSNPQTNDKRPLQGMPEFVFNVGLLYDAKAIGLSAGIFANIIGDRITAVGTSGLDDEVEKPRWNLDLSITKQVGNGTVKLTVENILNDNYLYKQSGFQTRDYRKGLSVGIGYSYSF